MADPISPPAPTPAPKPDSWFTKIRSSAFVQDALAKITTILQFLLDQLGKFLGTKKSGHLSGMDVLRICVYSALMYLSAKSDLIGIPPELAGGYTFVVLTIAHYFAGAMEDTPPAPAA